MKTKKVIAPIIITCLLVLYFIFWILGIISVPDLLWLKVIGIIIPLSFIGVSIFVLIERIKEIRSGEEDDLSKY
jgi:hypothetical protein